MSQSRWPMSPMYIVKVMFIRSGIRDPICMDKIECLERPDMDIKIPSLLGYNVTIGIFLFLVSFSLFPF